MSDEVIAGSSRRLAATFTDYDGSDMVPTAVSYEVLDMTTGTVVRASTTTAAGATITIPLTPSDTAMVRDSDSREHRRVVATATDSSGGQEVGIFDFTVKNPNK